MKIRFWGVRGSIPTPGEKTARFGGNTSCVEIITDGGNSLLFDAGTGIRGFGLDYLKRNSKSNVLNLFISHVHWDHIQGFPYFVPAFLADMEINIYSGQDIQKNMMSQMEAPYFPVKMSDLDSKVNFHVIGNAGMEVEGALVTPIKLIHPQEVYGFSVRQNDKMVVYSSDTEFKAGGEINGYVEAVKGADILLFDAQYTPEEYSGGREGWGHSTYEAAAEIAEKAGVKKLVLFHHEPTHDDAMVENIEKRARELFPETVAAREGMTLEV